jgi:hypothetical protein
MSAEDAPPGFLATWRHDPQSYRDALRRRIKSVGEICDGEPTYGPSADAQSGTAVYSGVIECADEDFGRGYFTAGVTSGDVALLFLHFSGPLDEAIGRQINATLRQSLLSY